MVIELVEPPKTFSVEKVERRRVLPTTDNLLTNNPLLCVLTVSIFLCSTEISAHDKKNEAICRYEISKVKGKGKGNHP